MKNHILFGSATIALVCPVHLHAQASIPADYLSIIGNTAGTVADFVGSPGSVPVFGRASFPVLTDVSSVPALAAGRYGDGVDANAARAVAAAQTNFFNTTGVGTTSQLFANSVLWASRQNLPANVTVGSNSSAIRNFFAARGYLTKAVTTSMSTAANDLSGCTVFVGNFHDGFTAAAIAKINSFTAAGGGIVVCSTPWALSSTALSDARGVLNPFGLTFGTATTTGGTFNVGAANLPAYHSAKIALDQVVADAQGGAAMTLAAKQAACAAVDRVLAVYPAQPELVAGLETLQGIHGWIAPTNASKLIVANSPVQAMLARYQSGKLDSLAPAQLFVHPSAADFPGVPAAGSPRLNNRVVTVNGNTAPGNTTYMNQASLPTRIETGLYAAPGDIVTITLPADKTAAGLQVHLAANGTESTTFAASSWNMFPKTWRRQSLNAVNNQVGNTFGGLVTILVPPGSNLGNFDITISNVLGSPSFRLGTDSDADWNNTIKNNPAPWGCVQTSKLTLYLPAYKLRAVPNMTEVATHWLNVMNLADDYYGYTPFRKRAEAMATSRDVVTSSGVYVGALAGYPIMSEWMDDDLLDGARLNGHWGSYHELGHGYQSDFSSAFVIPTGAEIDVNLLPGMVYTLIHDRTAWDNNTHSTFDAANRTADLATWLARPLAERTWANACQNDSTKPNRTYVAYDFYFNLSEGFGWAAYRTAFTRLMNWLQNQQNPALGAPDAALSALNANDPNYKRNLFYLLFCDATGRNLDAYFQTYGLGVVGGGYEITQSVKDAVTAKGYPVWNGNQPLTALTNPGNVNVPENTAPGTVIANLPANDPEPGTIFTYSITAGNGSGLFSINKRTGAISLVNKVDYETTAGGYNLTVLCQDNGLPRYSLSQSFNVTVGNVIEPPVGTGFATLNASSTLAAGTVLGQVITFDSARALASATIVSGNASGAFTVNASGNLVLTNPAALPATSLLTLVISATDSGGLTGHSSVRVIVNTTPGLYEQRWAGSNNFNTNTWAGAPNYTGNLASATTGQNVANTYSRRVTGWLVAPASGSYTFWISSDDDGRFYLGTDSAEASKNFLASVSGYTGFQAFDGQPSQKSAAVQLEAGKAYWFEAQQFDGAGGDHLSVAWQGPGMASRAVVPGASLIPARPGVAVVTQLPRPPSFASSPLVKTGATAFLPYTGSVASDASDPDAGDTLTFAKVSGPAWLSVAANGTLSGTPTNSDAGANSFTVSVTDSTNATVTTALNIPVAAADLAADPDGDGFTTGLELALGANPYANTSQPPALYANLRAWWRFDETSGTVADDTTGRAQDGAVTGATWAPGISGNSLSFNGVDNGVLMGAAPSVLGTGDFTVFAWVKVAPGSSGGAVIHQREAGTTGYQGEYVLNVNANGTVNFFVYGTSAYQFNLTTTATVNDGAWHLVSGVRSGATGSVYLDGVSAATGSGTVQSLGSHAVSVGYDNRDSNKRFNGWLDDIRVYERPLSAAELKGIHDALAPAPLPPPGPSFAAFADANFTPAERADLLVSGPAADPDQDGVSNLLEYALAMNPHVPSTANLPRTLVVPVSADLFVGLTYTRLKGATDLTFTPEFSSVPDSSGYTASAFTAVSTVDNGDGTETVTLRDNSTLGETNPRRFVRLRLEQN